MTEHAAAKAADGQALHACGDRLAQHANATGEAKTEYTRAIGIFGLAPNAIARTVSGEYVADAAVAFDRKRLPW